MEDHTRHRVLLVLFIGVLMGALDIAIIGPALPSIQKSVRSCLRSARPVG